MVEPRILVLLVASAFATAQRTWTEDFVAVQGSTLAARLNTAIGLASSNPFWVGYQVPVKPNIAIDTKEISIPWDSSIQGPDVSVNAASPTPDLGIFLYYDVDRLVRSVRIVNLRRRHELQPHLVYWLGRASGSESLAFLQDLLEKQPELGVALVRAIGIHEDKASASIVKRYWEGPSVDDLARQEALCWIGQAFGESSFLESVATDGRRSIREREAAVLALLESPDHAAQESVARLKTELTDSRLQRLIAKYERPRGLERSSPNAEKPN